MHIDLQDNAVPCRHYRPRLVPFRWRESVQQQLEHMASQSIIEKVPVGESFTWCHPMVVVPKKNSDEPRVTVDLTGLNKYVKRPAYPARTPHEAVAAITLGSKYFTTLDSRHGYWQIPLDEESLKLTTFLTPWGAFRFKRNVMGLISAGDEHNRRGDEALTGIKNMQKVVEDIIIFNDDLPSHIESVRQVLQRCAEHGITLNKKKFVFGVPETNYCGFKVSKAGYTPDDNLVSALRNFPTPTSKTDIRSLCGLAQQFEAFTPRLTELLTPIRALLSSKATFCWESVHQKAFEDLREALSCPRILATFDGKSPLRLETDAAQSRGLGMALWQQQPDGQWRLLQCGSRHITDTESRYSATEIELLAVVWAVQKARLFLAGSDFELVIDHRPLVPIINSKTLDGLTTPRIVRMKEKLAPYRLTAVWRAGVNHKVVDCLSRRPVDDPSPEDLSGENEIEHCHSVLFRLACEDAESGEDILSDGHIVSVRDKGRQDAEYNHLKQVITIGFPKEKSELPLELHPYWNDRTELSVINDVIFRGQRLVIPKLMRRSILQHLHASHQGETRTLQRARQTVFWPGITNDIRNMIRSCGSCAVLLPSQQREPLKADPPPSRPFEQTVADIFHLAGWQFLVLTDKFSGWPFVGKCGRTASTQDVINLLTSWFTDVGVPVTMTTDGGPQFKSTAFNTFCAEWGITHNVSSPYNHQSNGTAEAAVKSVKHLVTKCTKNGNLNSAVFKEGLLELRNTPKASGLSPAQLIYGYSLRTRVPANPRIYQPPVDFTSPGTNHEQSKVRNDTRARDMPRLTIGDWVRVQDHRDKRWETVAKVVGCNKRGRSYTVEMSDGSTRWRNRRFLRKYYGPTPF